MSPREARPPRPRGPRRAPIALPDTTDLAGVDAAEVAIVRLAAGGAIGAREALEFTRMLDHRRRVLVARDHEKRLVEIEEINRQRRAAEKGGS